MTFNYYNYYYNYY